MRAEIGRLGEPFMPVSAEGFAEGVAGVLTESFAEDFAEHLVFVAPCGFSDMQN